MTSISPLNNVHELGSFGNFEGKNSNEIITIKELKNFKIFQVVKYKTSKTNIKEYKIFDLNFPDDLKVSGNNDTRILWICLLYTSPSPRDATLSRMPSSA